MAVYQAVPLKRTWEVDLEKPLKTFIANTFTECKPEDYATALSDFSKLRNSMIAKSVDKHESALEVLYRYYDQLVAIDCKFPICENQIRINFKWQDAFDRESLFAGKRTLTIASAEYEKVSVLFNVAALQSQVAQSQNHSSDEGLKTSAKLFQQSSGIYAHLKEGILSSVQNEPTPDLHPDALSALASLMLAQGQDCFVRKAMQDKMKSAIIAKLSHQASDLYADALKLLQLDSIRALWPREWIPSVAGKQAAFHSLAEYFESLKCKEKKEFGEELARLKHAKTLMGAAENRGGQFFIFQDMQKKILRGVEAAEKDNNFIYHAKIPELSSLPSIGKASVAKSLPLSSPPLSSNFKDLFEKLVPLAVHQALAAFENSRAEMANVEIARLRESTQLMNSVLASLNLPAAIEDLSGEAVPASVLEKASQVREMGGAAYITRQMTELPELLQRNKEILDDAEKTLNEEQESDDQLRKQFKEKWTRTASEKLTQPLKAEAAKYRSIITNAISADGIVKERYNVHKECIQLLSLSQADIEQALPSMHGTQAGAVGSSGAAVQQLRSLMQQVDGLKAERQVTETQLKETESSTNMTSQLLSALGQDGALSNGEVLSAQQLDAIFSPLRKQVTESIQRQEQILANVQTANTEFTQARSQNQAATSREQKLKDLAAAFDSFCELKHNLEEGTKFYNDLTQLLVKFQSKVIDFCFARKTEKEELMKDLQKAITRQDTSPTPGVLHTGQAAAPGYPAGGYGAGYPSQQPYVPQMPSGYNPYASYPAPAAPAYPPQPQGYPPQQPYPGQPQAQYPGQPQYPPQPPSGYPGYPPYQQ
ncbi:hypothetical protein CAPTEDRAFT_127570 [Capitella teleta]|uniref:BRO1 domain-containing protein n=1 Tax=Capitella teleta TaxID=283909 RepID=R7TE60_CAPTE|nr:hypothetical protein CAPTEDRAFT_127570 [Capitella teleta]|eukprot:ELT89341.1 hypothetical protein CAPTEDRAFT_127570 [Capitella teleta]